MGLDMTMTVTEYAPRSQPEVSREVAETCDEAYEALKDLPANRQLNIDFKTTKEANKFVREAQQWASDNDLKFVRKPSGTNNGIRELPTRVTFRIIKPKAQP